MHATRRPSLVLLLGVCALGLAACGGKASNALTTNALTSAQYAAKASHLCLIAGDAAREMHLTLAMGDWSHNGAEINSINARFTKGLAALTPPSDIAHAAEEFRSRYKWVEDDDRAVVAAAQAGDRKKFHAALVKGGRDLSATYPWAQAVGATGCYYIQ
jgi:hypothetical protein